MSSLLFRICQLSKDTLRLIKPSRELFTYMFFLALSGVIWLAVSLNEEYEREVDIPVLIANVPENIAFDEGTEDTIRAIIRDKGFALISHAYMRDIAPIQFEFKSFRKKNGHLVVANPDLHRIIGQSISGTATIVSVKPEKLDYTYSECVSRVVPVRLAGKIEPAENYYLSQTLINPANVTIYLSRTMADSVKFVTTEDLEITNLSDTITVDARLKPIKGVNIHKKTVKVSLYADILTEEEVDVPITAINVPAGVSLRFFPQRVRVKFVVGVSMLKNINTSEFVVQADYNQIVPGSEKCTIAIVQKPGGVVKADTEISKVDYLIEN